METMKTTLTTGEVLELAGQKFFYSIDGERVALFVHASVDNPRNLTVSHFASGKKIADIAPTLVAACGKDVKVAAKITIDRLVERVGAERVKTAFRRG